MYREDDDEVVVALDAATGATRWRHAYHAPLRHDGYFDVWLNSAGPGPYSTPLIAGDLVFAVGVDGRFHALDKRTGELRWAHDLAEAFDVGVYNAFASSPIAYGRTVILPLGGQRRRGGGARAGNRGDGLAQSGLRPGARLPGADRRRRPGPARGARPAGAGRLDARSGRRLWSHPHPNELGLNISMPVWGDDDALFLSSGYGGGSRLIRLSRVDDRTTPEEVWFNSRMRLHFGNALRIGGLVVGSTGDFGPAFVAALDAATGREVWRERSFARAQLVQAGNRLVIVDEDGELAVASVTGEGLDVHARAAVLTANAWTPPTLVGNVLYLRDRQNILALDLRGRRAPASPDE